MIGNPENKTPMAKDAAVSRNEHSNVTHGVEEVDEDKCVLVGWIGWRHEGDGNCPRSEDSFWT